MSIYINSKQVSRNGEITTKKERGSLEPPLHGGPIRALFIAKRLHPETNQTAQNFPAAKQMIDILAMLQIKTKGNLTEAEEALIEQVLFSLRIHYVRTVEGQKKSGG